MKQLLNKFNTMIRLSKKKSLLNDCYLIICVKIILGEIQIKDYSADIE